MKKFLNIILIMMLAMSLMGCDGEKSLVIFGNKHECVDSDNDHKCDECGQCLHVRLADVCGFCEICIDNIPPVDEDGDKICDLCGRSTCSQYQHCHLDRDNDKFCDRCDFNICGIYGNHVDENNDSICDFCKRDINEYFYYYPDEILFNGDCYKYTSAIYIDKALFNFDGCKDVNALKEMIEKYPQSLLPGYDDIYVFTDGVNFYDILIYQQDDFQYGLATQSIDTENGYIDNKILFKEDGEIVHQSYSVIDADRTMTTESYYTVERYGGKINDCYSKSVTTENGDVLYLYKREESDTEIFIDEREGNRGTATTIYKWRDNKTYVTTYKYINYERIPLTRTSDDLDMWWKYVSEDSIIQTEIYSEDRGYGDTVHYILDGLGNGPTHIVSLTRTYKGVTNYYTYDTMPWGTGMLYPERIVSF
ncbi:MAG: hypothetical protein Q4B60_09640 [Erysipelotrichaceae bacterium]|nr:hypothetical protein [Erysipelotrichaceae bacterium]